MWYLSFCIGLELSLFFFHSIFAESLDNHNVLHSKTTTLYSIYEQQFWTKPAC